MTMVYFIDHTASTWKVNGQNLCSLVTMPYFKDLHSIKLEDCKKNKEYDRTS